MPQKGLLVRDWKQDVINLVHLPRAKCVPDPSPYALKLETWLRFTKLNYVNVSNDFTKTSSKGQIPFIELNGRQFADSNLIIEHLIQTFNLNIDRNLTTQERAQSRAINVLIEESLIRCIAYDRMCNANWMFSLDKGLLSHLHGVKNLIAPKIGPAMLQRRLKSLLHAQGYGRFTQDEIDEIAKKDLTALSTFLGDKQYIFGDRPTSVDAPLFAAIAEIHCAPMTSQKIKPFMEQNTQNLIDFFERVKTEYWPDWTNATEHQILNSHIVETPKPQQSTSS